MLSGINSGRNAKSGGSFRVPGPFRKAPSGGKVDTAMHWAKQVAVSAVEWDGLYIYIYYICYNTRKICTGQVRWVVAAICGPTPKRGNHGAWLLIHKGGFGGFTVCRYRKSSPNSCGIERGSQVQGCSRSCIPGVSIQAIGCLQNESVFWACQFYAWFYVILMSWHVILIMRHFLSL